MNEKRVTYKDAGVDINAGYEVVKRIKAHARSTYRPEVITDLGSFGALFAFDNRKYEEPILVSGTDGVGTKLKIAFLMDKHDTVGLDLVAYCINDIICQGAEPLFFLDYLATGKVKPEVIETLVAGIARGCKEAGCALIGGETAEMPGFYDQGEYDMAGFAVGVVERKNAIDGSKVKPGDALVGIKSTGLQSSGYSLVRKVVFDILGLKVNHYIEEFGRSLGEELLEPTRIYARQLLKIQERFDIHGIANISGGGLPENLPRAIANNTRVIVQKGTWEIHPVFKFLQERGGVDEDEMYNTFNMGVGMVLIVSGEDADGVCRELKAMGEEAYIIGQVVAGERGIDLV
jgi:phosphoribosylformylglycinamidine cyclo-ligase